jgi:glycosyltransferase involved in cell wall biosynthesis
MRIGYNCLHLLPGQLGGLETFLHGLLDDVGQAQSNHELVIFCSSRYQSEFNRYADRFELIGLDVNVHSAAKRIHYEQFELPKTAANRGIDVLHSSGYTGPMTKRCKTVMNVHDLNYIEIPKLIRRSHGAVRWSVLRMLGPMSMRRADKILTISNHVRHQITRLLNIQPERIATIHARSPCDFSKVSGQPVELPPKCADGFLLYVASWLPHKNHEVLLRAMSEAKRQKKKLPPLVLAGLHLRSESDRSSVRTALQRHDLEEHVHCVDQRLSLEHLADLYQRASAFVFPSLFEGFGIPVAEAMSAKIPVICSAVEPMIEVTSGAAITFNPHNSTELLDRMLAVLENNTLRDELVERGYERYLALQRASQLAGTEVIKIYESLTE